VEPHGEACVCQTSAALLPWDTVMKSVGILLSVVLLVPLFPPVAQAKQETTTLRIVVQNEQGEPVPRASLIVRQLKGKKHNKVSGSMELRASQEGVAPLPPMKRGFILIQVIAEDYQTFGDQYELTEPEQTITITLKPPQKQYSVH
jgi:hypothetical protein